MIIFDFIQALKSLTLVRLGKDQEAVTLLKEVRECKPSDESTLLALTACYRELRKRNFNSIYVDMMYILF